MAKNDNSSGSIKRYSAVILVIAIITKKYLTVPEPLACTTMRDILLSSKKANDIMLEKDPSVPGVFPKIPLEMVKDCGARSWRMPYPYTFKFMDDPLSEDELIKIFLERNKEVRYRDNVPGETALFGKSVSNRALPVKGPFSKAWECISKGTCSMYFDNTWTKEDYKKIMPRDIYDILSTNKYGSMFLSNSNKFYRTVSAHAEYSNSVSLQMVNNKTWEIIPPYVAKKYLPVKKQAGIALIEFNAVNQTKYLDHVPHYRFTVTPGEGFFFPGYYFHIVYNYPGVNIMTSWRQLGHQLEMLHLSPLNPLDTLHHILQSLLTEKILPEAVFKRIHIKMSEKRQVNPVRELRDKYIDHIYDLNL